MCIGEPAPGLAKVTCLPPLAAVMSSGKVLAPMRGLATISMGCTATWMIGSKPFSTSYDAAPDSFMTKGAVVNGLGVKSRV